MVPRIGLFQKLAYSAWADLVKGHNMAFFTRLIPPMHPDPRPPNDLRFIDVQAGLPWQARPIHVSRRRHESRFSPAHFRESPNPGRGAPAMAEPISTPMIVGQVVAFFVALLANHDKGGHFPY